MTMIEKTWTRFPGEPIAQEEIIEILPRWVGGDQLRLAKQLFQRSCVSSRHMVLSPAELATPGRTFVQKNDLYKRVIREEVGALSASIGAELSNEARSSIDLLVSVSCTGFQIPAMDARIIQALDLPRGVRRLNLTEHGCAGGAAALGLAHEWLAAHPTRRALVVAAELCSLAFQAEDTSAENLVSAAIFGDGAAAVLLAGPLAEPAREGAPGLQIRDTYREFFPHTEHFMGFEVNDAGLKIKLSQDIVAFSRGELPALFERACAAWDVTGPHAFEIGSLHPGGRRILEILEDEVGISSAVTWTSWECLRRYGNLSSVSVLVALDRLLIDRAKLRPGALGLLSAFGPGFGAELSLLEAVA
uniref:3-oxoacyl-acyl-carrier-protein synthase III n=1 Tax=Byssovorax cruenta TaxID=293647 RepID=A0A3S5GXZ2_9BACT|nr:3-oxoacyl-acyl-carrier-protein synthase III [Byssovorax cruenta]